MTRTSDQAPLPIDYAKSDTPPDHRAERNRRLKWTLLVAVLTKPLALLSRLVITPLFLRYLGKDGYGHYEEVVSTAMLLSLTNLGLTLGLINRLMDCHVSGNRALARRYLSSLFFAVGAIVAVCLIGWTIASVTVPWVRVFKVTDPRWVAQIRLTVWITGCTILMGLLFGLPTTVYLGYQENARAFGWDAVTKIAVFIASLGVVYTHWGLLGVAIATCGVTQAVNLLNTITILFIQKPWLMPRLKDFDWALVKSTLVDGIALFAMMSAVMLIFQCDKLVIGSILTPGDVAVYSLVGGLFIVAYGVYALIVSPLWSFHGEALRRGDWPWVRKALYLSQLAGLALLGGCTALLLVFGDWIFTVWTRGQYHHVSRPLILGVGAMFIMRTWVDCRSTVLNAAGVLKPQVGFFLAHAALNLLGAILVARRFGVTGVAWVTPITAVLTSAWGYPILIRRLAAKLESGAVVTTEPALAAAPVEEPL